MNFYLGNEINGYNRKVEAIKDHLKKTKLIRKGSRSEAFRYMVDEVFRIVEETKKDIKKNGDVKNDK